jgi:hypothetical protein
MGEGDSGILNRNIRLRVPMSARLIGSKWTVCRAQVGGFIRGRTMSIVVIVDEERFLFSRGSRGWSFDISARLIL